MGSPHSPFHHPQDYAHGHPPFYAHATAKEIEKGPEHGLE